MRRFSPSNAPCPARLKPGRRPADNPRVMRPLPSSASRRAPGWLLALVWVAALWLAASVSVLASAVESAPPEPLRLDERGAVPAWPAVTLLADPGGTLDAGQAAGQLSRFTVPTGTPSNLGRRDEVIWLHIPLQVPAAQPVRRIVEIDYPTLNEIDLYVLRDGQIRAHLRMGNRLARSERPLPSRTHAAPLDLEPGASALLVRVQTLTSLVVPITLRTPEDFTARESQVQIVQGLILGLAAFMLLYSLSHWIHLRDRMFLQYALMLAGNMVFVLAFFGIGAQYLWPEWPQLSMRVAPIGMMVTVAAGTAFMLDALDVREISRRIDLVLRAIAWAALALLAAALAGAIGYRPAQTLVTVLGLATSVLVLPVAYLRARRGERVATIMLVGWAFYVAGAFTAAGLLRGYIEPGPWVQHVYPLTMIAEMTTWMAVLGLRVHQIHRSADRARLEADTLRALAQTDALTGLPNRRGLQERLHGELARCDPNRVLALFLLDLDGFKAVNDRWGHDVGDALLIEVGRRLQSLLRGGDVIARLGGDEFVVLAAALADEGAAQRLGQKLLAAFDEPFHAAGQRCEVGVTAGYALAPLDGTQAEELVKRADAAMYAGKQAGRRRVQRGGRKLAAA